MMPFSNESEHTQLMTSLIINLSSAVFYLQWLPWEDLDKSRVNSDSSSSGHEQRSYHSVPSSAAHYFCEASSSSFRVLLRPRSANRFGPLYLNVRSVGRMALQCPPLPVHLILLRSPLLDFPCATSATPIAPDRLFLNVRCEVLQLNEELLNSLNE